MNSGNTGRFVIPNLDLQTKQTFPPSIACFFHSSFAFFDIPGLRAFPPACRSTEAPGFASALALVSTEMSFPASISIPSLALTSAFPPNTFHPNFALPSLCLPF